MVGPAWAQAVVALDLKDEALSALVLRHVPLFSDHSKQDPSNDDALFAQTDKAVQIKQAQEVISEILRTEGYFTPSFEYEYGQDNAVQRIRVEPGPRARVEQVHIYWQDAVTEPVYAERRAKIEADFHLKPGMPFRQSDWSRSKQNFLNALLARDFAAARIVHALATVNPETQTVALQVTAASGPAFKLGALQVEGLEDYAEDLVTRFNNLSPGEAFDQDRLVAFQTALQNTPYFGAVSVDIDRTPELAESAPVHVRLTETVPKRLSFSAGASSNTGYRAEGSYRNANFLGRGWESVSGFRIEQRGYSVFSDLILPPSMAGHNTSLGAQVLRNTHQGLTQLNRAIGVNRSWPIEGGERQATLKWQHENLRLEGLGRSELQALTLDLTRIWRWIDDPLNPRKGRVLSMRVGGGSKSLGSDQDFLRTTARWTEYLPVGERDTIQLRAEYGASLAPSRKGIPQDFLFRTGGTQTVRGYDYQSLGVESGKAIVGGRYMGTASAEYTHWLPESPDFGWAVFVDAGNARDKPLFQWKQGYGLGGRWKSPAGPIAVDLAYGQEDRTVKLHFAVMIAF